MKKRIIPAILLAAFIAAAPLAGCRDNTKKVKPSSNTEASAYADISEIGKNKYDVSLSENADVNETGFKINRVIDSGRVKDGLKYIYLDVTIKNNSADNHDITPINNFYLILKDGTEVLTDIRADIYAKQAMDGYVHLEKVAAGKEFTGYIGFVVDEDVKEFTACFFPTGKNDDKTNVVRCEITEKDIVTAPEGMFSKK